MKFLETGVIKISKLKRYKKFKELTPRPTQKDFESLSNSLRKDGQLVEIDVDQDNHLLDGFTRCEALWQIGQKSVRYNKWNFTSLKGRIQFIITKNLSRRHMNEWMKIITTFPILEEEKKKAKKRKEHPEDARRKAIEVPAKLAGVSTSTYERALFVFENADEELKRKLYSDTTKIKTAYNQLTQKTRNLPKVEVPAGQYDVLYYDPPPAFDNKTIRGSAANNYETMDLDKLKNLKIPAAKNSIMFCWWPMTFVVDGTAADVLKCWGFTPKTGFVWDKEMIGTGSWLRNQHEVLIMSIKGNMPTPAKLYPSIFREKRTKKHSQKPTKFYKMIETMYPKRKYLEGFARTKRKGWTSWGNQVE